MNRHACTKLLQDPNYIFCSSRKAIFWSYLVLFNNNQCELIIIIKAHINKPMMNDSQQPSENDLERAIDFEDNNNPQLIQIIKNAKFLCKKGSNVDNDQKLKNIIELNKHIKEIEHQRKLIEYIQKDELIIVIRDLLLDRDLKTRQEACKCLRRLINKSTIMIDKYKQYKIHFLISRNIEKDIKTKGSGTKSVEAIECRLI
jgi:hypothetical protein